MKNFMEYAKENYFVIKKDGVEKGKLSIVVFGILFIIFWKLCSVLMIIGLFFNLEYSFTGMNSNEGLNGFFVSIKKIVQDIKSTFQENKTIKEE